MADIGSLFKFFGAAGFIVLRFFISKMFGGMLGLLIKAGIGIGLAIGASFAAKYCASLGVIMVAAAIIIGGLFGIVVLMGAQYLPWIGGAISTALTPFNAIMWTLLILAIVHFVIEILSVIFALVPILNIIAIILSIAIPLIMLYLMWAPFGDAFASLPKCIGIGEGQTSGPVPGTGGVMIGTK